MTVNSDKEMIFMQTFYCMHTYPSGYQSRWSGSWEVLSTEPSVHELRIRGKGSSFDVILGSCCSGNYLCIPQINVGCSLGYWSDIFWNTERMTQVLSETDAVTIANALNHYGNNR